MMTDKQLLRCATQFRKGMIGKGSSARKCAMVSWPLAGMLGAMGVECRTVEGDLGFCNHIWIELADGRVLDPTMDQFNIDDGLGQDWPPVYLGPPTFLHPKSLAQKPGSAVKDNPRIEKSMRPKSSRTQGPASNRIGTLNP